MSDMPDYVRALYTSVKNTWQDAENLDDTHGYTTYVWIPEETYKVDIMKLHVFAEKFRAYSKAAASGGGTVVTSAAGGGTTVTSEYTSIPHTHDVTIGNHTHNVTIPNHTHDVNIGTKTSTSESTLKHIIAEAPETGTFTPDAYMDVFDVNGAIIASINVKRYATATPYTIGDAQAHSHNVNYGTKTSSAGGGTTVTSAAGGGTTVTSASGGGSHSHNVTIPNHTHDVTIPNHTHGIDYGIYEEGISGRTLSAILYDPDGNLLKDFGVVCTGEDSQVIDLSDYFSTLKYGMYRLELSASGRLRARLVFYELCKMYAI